ncbi:uncharacterized protein LOC121593984 [Anopheles merus]|uniref:uncharacterized protein LOC121593984 n=1 Tax=Anopheles merus TaxID=30066 RepID=UPI001BE3F1A2|nr:uncharacterized protein LOC121593984 [Anopheles merus]
MMFHALKEQIKEMVRGKLLQYLQTTNKLLKLCSSVKGNGTKLKHMSPFQGESWPESDLNNGPGRRNTIQQVSSPIRRSISKLENGMSMRMLRLCSVDTSGLQRLLPKENWI